MKEIDFMSSLHKSTKRDYLKRVNESEYPKAKAAELAKKFDFDYWDGDRRICYGGYNYIPGRWTKVAKEMIDFYKLTNDSKILDIGCGKGYLLYEISLILPNAKLFGLDISEYAINNSKEEIKNNLKIGNATNLPWEDNYFDFVYSLNSLHCLPARDLYKSLIEMERVGKNDKYLCVESFRNEEEKANLLYWQVTCESFHNKDSWQWWFELTGYKGDYSFIYFE
tara:strand:- start:578 stop:1249 length:672 start_codon:yes stop_codon:yes gene_type:complete